MIPEEIAQVLYAKFHSTGVMSFTFEEWLEYEGYSIL